MIRNTFSKLKTIFTPRPSATNISPRLLELATSGNVDAQAKLAEIYFNDGGAEHYAASLHWNRQAARQGHPAAQARLAIGEDLAWLESVRSSDTRASDTAEAVSQKA